MIYPRLWNFGIEPVGDMDAVDPDEIEAALKRENMDIDEFNKLLGISTCPIINGKTMLYAWDAEAVLERMISGMKTGTQLLWD